MSWNARRYGPKLTTPGLTPTSLRLASYVRTVDDPAADRITSRIIEPLTSKTSTVDCLWLRTLSASHTSYTQRSPTLGHPGFAAAAGAVGLMAAGVFAA